MKRLVMIILLLAILAGGGGTVWYWVMLPHKAETLTSPLQPTPTPVPPTPTGSFLETDTHDIRDTVTRFYAAYQACLKQPPPEARGKVAVYCQANTGQTSEEFTANLAQGGTARRGADPLICSQNPPASVSVGDIDYEAPDRAVATATALYGGGFAQKISIVVVKENTEWRVDTVNCPRP